MADTLHPTPPHYPTQMLSITELSDTFLTLERNQFLSVKGSIDRNVYFIKSGSLKIYITNADQEHITRLAYQKNMVVCLDSFLTGQPTVFYIQAIKKTHLQVISREQLETFLREEKNVGLWNQVLESLVLQQMEREIDLLTPSPKERYLRILRRSPQLFQEIPHRHIAQYLRMSPETLSRLKSLDLDQGFGG